ncbi:MAG: cation diffusion facilitator family transporter [Candidatus Omnitrophota bacterium]|nr:cation diffusion facilitator family transporter [Candidatus Omnitrophota bacterium]
MAKRPEVYMLRATLVSLFCNIILVSIKTTALILVNSLAIAVDLGISFVGLTVSVILYYSIKLANRPADLIHNYGYGKVENVCETMEGVVLIGIALAMSFQAALSVFHPKDITMPLVGLVSCLVNSCLNFGGASYIFLMARKSGSPAIHAEGIHYRLEGVISVVIAVSFVISMLLRANGLTGPAIYIDPFAALLVSVIIIIPSFALAKRSFFKLLDASVEEDSQIEILKQLSNHINDYCEFKELKTRTAGRKKFVEFSLIVPENITFRRGHEIRNTLERDIKAGIPNCEVVIKMEPCSEDCEYVRKRRKCPYM